MSDRVTGRKVTNPKGNVANLTGMGKGRPKGAPNKISNSVKEQILAALEKLGGVMKDLQDIVHDLKARNIALKATEQPIDTSTAAGKCFLDMLGVFAEFETNLRRERQLEGIAVAKADGVYKGRVPKVPIDAATVVRLRSEGVAVHDGVILVTRRLTDIIHLPD
jgi:DNA invertase Pin-like site-specific DNA recombinase